MREACGQNCVVANNQGRNHGIKKTSPKFHKVLRSPVTLSNIPNISNTSLQTQLNLTTSASISRLPKTYRTADPTSLKKAQMIRAKNVDKRTSLLFEICTIFACDAQCWRDVADKRSSYRVDILRSTKNHAIKLKIATGQSDNPGV